MSNYRKTMASALQEMYPINEDNIDLMRKAAGGAAQTVKMKDGKLQMDMFTASAIMKVFDKVNPANQKKMADMINKGTKGGMMKLQDFAMKQVKSENDPEIEEQLAKIKGNSPADKGREAAVEDDIERAEKKGDKKEVEKLKEAELDEARQLKDPKKEMMVSKAGKVEVIDKEDWNKYEKKGYVQAEEAELDEDFSVEVPKQKIAGKTYGGGATVIVKAKTASQAIKMVAKRLDVDVNLLKTGKVVKEEVDLEEGYLELTFKSKQDAEKAYNKINNEIFAAGSVPYDDMNQEGNEIQFDLDGNLNRRNQILKDLKSGGIKNFKVTANEELKEGKMSQLHQLIKDKKSAEEIAKIMKLDVKTVKTLMASHYREDVEEGAESDARRGMSKDPDFSRKDSADVDDDATDDDVKGASKNIIMQMRKAVSLRGKFDVVFGDGKKIKVPEKVAQVVQQKYNSLRKTSDKEKFQAQVAKSYKDMLKVVKAGYGEQKESILDRIDRKIKENKNG